MQRAIASHSVNVLPALFLMLATAMLPASAGDAVDVMPYPTVAGEAVTVSYYPPGRVLDSASQVYMHYGINEWDTTYAPDITMSWDSGAGAWVGTVTVPAGAGLLDLAFHDGNGTWDNNGQSDWHVFVSGGTEWDIDGQLDEDAILVGENNGYELYAGLRDSILYIAAPGAGSGKDHFIFLADTPGAFVSAPWAKAGHVADWSAYIGNEGDSAWAGWFDNAGASQVAGGTWVEGTLDLADEFGSLPTHIYLAFATYETADYGVLDYTSQVPASNDNDGDVDANEYVLIDLGTIMVGCPAADLDDDCDQDVDDLDLLLGCLLGPDVTSCDAADLEIDGDVDVRDYAAFQLVLGETLGEAVAIAEDLGTDVTRYYPDTVDLADLPPSMSLAVTPIVYGPAAKPWVIQPNFFYSGTRHVAHIPMPDDVSLYGTGEVCGELLRSGYSTEAWNTDAYGYGPRQPRLYQSHPWVLAVRPDGSAVGVLADTTYRCRIDLTDDILFAAEGPAFPVYAFEGDSPQEVLMRLTDFIGRMELPPRWSLGYQQSRYSYAPESYARWIAGEFRSRDIPCDVIWFDIDYMDDYRIFTFDSWGFPDPVGLNDDLHAQGFRTVWMIDPGVKVESGYFVYDQGSTGDHWIYNSSGYWYTGVVWPGDCHFPDYTRPETRTWWAGLYDNFMAQGCDGVWNDMNEPGIFDGPGHSMPEDCWHRGGGGLPAGAHEQYHNVYGMLMVQASREGILAAEPTRRPFVLSRANFIGGHRYAAMWTGDNVANWSHLYYSAPMVMNLGLSAQPFAGPDLGGFADDGSADLFARWMGVGVFMPFCRAHADNAGIDKEPWSFGTYVEDACRTAIQRRYRLMPYLYTVFEEASTTGLPVVRPMFFADPDDASLRSETIAFMLGSDLIVAPEVYENPSWQPAPALPSGSWRIISLVGENSTTDVNQPDLRIRDGAIIPLGPVMEYTDELALDPLTLVVSLDSSGQAEGWLYEDDGDGFDYLSGDYRLAQYVATQIGNDVSIEVAQINGQMATPSRQAVVEIVTDSGVVTGTGVDNDGGVITVITLP